MKIFIKTIIILISILTFTNLSVFSYEISDKDYEIVDEINEKIFTLIENKETLTPEKTVIILEKYLENRVNNERLEEILYVVIDDIEYEYYLWDYSEDLYIDQDEDFSEEFTNDKFNLDNQSKESSWVEENIVASYTISWDNIKLVSWTEDKKHHSIFKLFTTLIPKAQRKDFHIFNIDNLSYSDTFAHVIQDKTDSNKWNMTVNLWLFYPNEELDSKESIYTLIHEYSHVLTLWKEQVDYYNFDLCNTRLLQEWCLNDDSYLHWFINSFWSKNFRLSQEAENNDFYTWNESSFVTDYASTNPWEDIAESFTNFVINNKPTWNTVAEKKKIFFYNYPELVKLRNIIRGNLSSFK